MKENNIEYRLEVWENPDGTATLLFQVLKMNEKFRRLPGSDVNTVHTNGHKVKSISYPQIETSAKSIVLRGADNDLDNRVANATFENIEKAKYEKSEIEKALKEWSECMGDQKSENKLQGPEIKGL